MIPQFAIVGRTNKGKSSLVATLSEDDRIAIAPTPRTTQRSSAHTFQVNGRPLFILHDTPGFEDAPAILEWLKSEPVHAHERRARVEAFYREFAAKGTYRFECELLKPVLDGAAILYVADASHPYRPNFEAEFEILQWTGQPSMALLNQIGEGDYKDEWTRALEQYFRKVKVFNAHSSWIRDRVGLIEELAFLSDEMAVPLREAARQILQLQEDRLRDAAFVIADVIAESLTFELKVDVDAVRSDSEIIFEFFDDLRRIEIKGRERLMQVFGFHQLKAEGDEKPVEDDELPDLFSKEQWEILGLTRGQLVTAGTVTGAFAGGAIDAMVGGASFMLGGGLGGIAGAVSSAYLAFNDPDVAGIKLSKRVKTVGPYKNPNFPWVLLDRQLQFVRALARRSHAKRGNLEWNPSGPKKGFTTQLKRWQMSKLNLYFHNIRWGIAPQKTRESLADDIREIWAEEHQEKPRSGDPRPVL